MELVLEKQPRKYLASVDKPTREKLTRALDGLLNLEGDIVKLKGKKKNYYRLKIDHYRVIFIYNGDEIIIVNTIDSRTNIKYREYE